MKGNAYCPKCKRDVKIKELYICGTVINIYLKCGHHFHLHTKGELKGS